MSDHPQPADVPATGYISGTRTRDAITQTAQVMQALHEACDSQAVGGPEGQKQPRAPSVEREFLVAPSPSAVQTIEADLSPGKDKHKCVTSSHESTAVHHPAAPVPFARASSSAGPVREAVIERSEPSRPPKNPSTLTSWTGRVAADPCSVAWNRGCSLNNCQALRPNSRQYSQARPSGSSRRVKSAPPEIKSKTPEEPKNKEIVRPAWSDCHYDGPMSHLEQPESIPEAGESGMPKAENKAEDIAEDAPQAQPKPEDKAEDPPQPQPKPEHSDEGKQSQSEAQDPPTSEKKEPLVELGVGRVLDKIVEETDGDWELLERPVSPEAAVKRTFRNPDGRGYFNNRTCFAARNCAPMLC